jgi:hypothetical protein
MLFPVCNISNAFFELNVCKRAAHRSQCADTQKFRLVPWGRSKFDSSVMVKDTVTVTVTVTVKDTITVTVTELLF